MPSKADVEEALAPLTLSRGSLADRSWRDEILDVVRRCHEAVREKAPRVLIELSLDDREVPEGAMVRSLNHLREAEGTLPLERILRK